MLTLNFFERFVGFVDCCPWESYAGGHQTQGFQPSSALGCVAPLYTAEQRVRRDATRWTTVQGVLAPVQFCVFLVSLYLVLHYLSTGKGEGFATTSVVVKTIALYTIMVTGSIWERVVFGRYLFAPAFFWEDVFSMLVLALHTLYLVALATGWIGVEGRMYIALAAYATYVINATQFVLKLRAARLDEAARTRSFGAHGLHS